MDGIPNSKFLLKFAVNAGRILQITKNECGKPYHRLNYFLCEALEFSQTTLERFIESNPWFGRIEPFK